VRTKGTIIRGTKYSETAGEQISQDTKEKETLAGQRATLERITLWGRGPATDSPIKLKRTGSKAGYRRTCGMNGEAKIVQNGNFIDTTKQRERKEEKVCCSGAGKFACHGERIGALLNNCSREERGAKKYKGGGGGGGGGCIVCETLAKVRNGLRGNWG